MNKTAMPEIASDMIEYYGRRAGVYDRVYDKPERRQALLAVAERLQAAVRQKEVYELACGTGYWTRIMADAAASVFATDINESMLELARNRNAGFGNVHFARENLYDQPSGAPAGVLFAGFIWSHIDVREMPAFLDALRVRVGPGGQVFLVDNLFVPGSNTPLEAPDGFGNTYQIRELEDGGRFKILKNFPTEGQMRKWWEPYASQLEWLELEYFWVAEIKINNG